MNVFKAKSLAAGVVGALCLAAPLSLHAEDAAPPAPVPAAAPADPAPAPVAPAPAVAKVAARTTLEQQIDYLEGALAEGIDNLDWKMATLAADGFKTAGLTGKDLEISLLRAERTAVIEHTGPGNAGPQVLALGMTVRAQLGDAASLTTLQSWAKDEIPAVKAPDQALWKDAPAEAVKAQKAYTTYQQTVSRREYAILGLALLKQPGVVEQALAALKNPADQGGGGGGAFGFGGPGGPGGFGGARGFMRAFGGRGGGGSADPLVLAALAADPQAGFKALTDFMTDDKGNLAQQATVVQSLARIAPGSKVRKPVDEQFSLEADLGAKLPADSFAQLSKPYLALIKRWKPDDANNRANGALTQLLSAGNDFPEKSIDADGITALQQLKEQITGQQGNWLKPQIDSVLRKQGVDPNAATKPPAPPKDF